MDKDVPLLDLGEATRIKDETPNSKDHEAKSNSAEPPTKDRTKPESTEDEKPLSFEIIKEDQEIVLKKDYLDAEKNMVKEPQQKHHPTQAPKQPHPTTTLAKSPDIITPPNMQAYIKKFLDELPQSTTPQQKQMLDQMMNLLLQMGSDQLFLTQGMIDERKLGNINENDQISLGYFDYRGRVDRIRYYSHLVDWILVSSSSVNGLRARQFIQLANAMSGSPQPEIVQKPGWFGRNVTNRDWEKKAQERGAIVVDKA